MSKDTNKLSAHLTRPPFIALTQYAVTVCTLEDASSQSIQWDEKRREENGTEWNGTKCNQSFERVENNLFQNK